MELFYQRWNLPKSTLQNKFNDKANEKTQTQPKLVLLHGMGGTGSLWRPIAVSLESELDILAPDQRGHGRSQISFDPSVAEGNSTEKPQYTPLDYGKDVIDTLTALNFFPTWIVGHSMGVRTALAAAILKPEWIKGLILIDLGLSGLAGGGLGQDLSRLIHRLPNQFSSRDIAKNFLKENCPDPAITQYLMAVLKKNLDGHFAFPFDHSALLETLSAAQNFSLRPWVETLGQRSIPILMLRGEKSLVWSQNDFMREKEIFSHLKSVQFIEFPNAGHGLPFEQRPAFVSLVLEHLMH